MRRISSSAVQWQRKAFPIIWFGFLGMFTMVIAAQIAVGKMPKLIILIPLGQGLFGYLGIRLVIRPLADEVYLDGNTLIVRKDGDEERQPLADIIDVHSGWLWNPERITLTFRHPGRFGRKILFAPLGRWFRDGVHPIADELNFLIEDAGGSTLPPFERQQFGR